MGRRHSDTDYQPEEVFELYKHLGPGRSIQGLAQAITANQGRNAPSMSTLKRWRKDGRWDERTPEYDMQVAERVDCRNIEAEALDRTQTINRLLAIRRRALDISEIMLGIQPPRKINGHEIEPVNFAQPTSLDLQRVAKVAAEATTHALELDRWPIIPQPRDDYPRDVEGLKEELNKVMCYAMALQKEIRHQEGVIDVPTPVFETGEPGGRS